MIITTAVAVAAPAGCATPLTCPRVIFLDGAGWASGHGPVKAGIRKAGYSGHFERFEWSSLLGPLPDHVMAGPDHPRVTSLANRITRLRRADPSGKIVLMALSAGTSIVVHALEKLPADVAVDCVVLLSPSVSSSHDLTRALRHVNQRLYATSSRHDPILAVSNSAGMEGGRPAGQIGFRLPLYFDNEKHGLYAKVVNLPWRPEYVAYGWSGRHVSVTNSEFIRVVIGPRIIDDKPHPLDRPMGAL